MSVRTVGNIPARGRPVNRALHLMPYVVSRRCQALRPWMDLAISLASLTNRWGADLLPEEFVQVLRDWRAADGQDPRNLSFAAAAAGCWGFPTWVCWCSLATLREEVRQGFGSVVMLEATPAQVEAGYPERYCAAVRGFRMAGGTSHVLLCDPWAGESDFDAETQMRWTISWWRGTMWRCSCAPAPPTTRPPARPGAACGCARRARQPPASTGCTATANCTCWGMTSAKTAASWPGARRTTIPMPPPPTAPSVHPAGGGRSAAGHHGGKPQIHSLRHRHRRQHAGGGPYTVTLRPPRNRGGPLFVRRPETPDGKRGKRAAKSGKVTIF